MTKSFAESVNCTLYPEVYEYLVMMINCHDNGSLSHDYVTVKTLSKEDQCPINPALAEEVSLIISVLPGTCAIILIIFRSYFVSVDCLYVNR